MVNTNSGRMAIFDTRKDAREYIAQRCGVPPKLTLHRAYVRLARNA